MARLVRRKCPCLGAVKEEGEVRVLDFRHSGLTDLPSDVFNVERTLEELCADSNQIRDLPRELFYCYDLRKLSVSDNEITAIPPAIASLHHLQELDVSKNGIIDVPDNIKCCKYLRVLDASVNPLGKLPDGFTQLQNLTHLHLNDTFLDYLPGSFGRLVKLKILEMRENHLKTLPKSFGRLTDLERLDIGHNDFTELPDVVGCLTKLSELWCDNNHITSMTHTVGGLKQLMFLDASRNQLTSLPGEIEGCCSLADLHLTSNLLTALPEAIGQLISLTTLKVDDNQLTSLPSTLGRLTALSELNVSINDLEELPVSVGLLRNLRTLYADDNLLTHLPAEVGSCSGLTVLSVRGNRLTYIPDELGRIPRLRVLNLSHNRLAHLPYTIVKLKELQALWLSESQTRPLIPLQTDQEDDTGRKILTCYLLPQCHTQHTDNGDDGDEDSFHSSTWDEERLQRQRTHFSFGDDDDDQGHLVRCPTPYPRVMREKGHHLRQLALRQTMGDNLHSPSSFPQSPHSWQGGREGRAGHPGSQEHAQAEDDRDSKPQPPSLQESQHLYRCDKERLTRDKARMQHRHSIPGDVAMLTSLSPHHCGGGAYRATDRDEGRVVGRRQSTPNLLSFDRQASSGKLSRPMPSFTYEDLYHRQILRKHHHHGRRSRRMREYDSDTGYRSDREVSLRRQSHSGVSGQELSFGGHRDVKEDSICREDREACRRQRQSDVTGDRDDSTDQEVWHRERDDDVTEDTDYRCGRRVLFGRQGHHHTPRHSDIKDDLSVRSQPTMSRSHHRETRREGGYTSDVEAYGGRGRKRTGGAPSLRPQPHHHHSNPNPSGPLDLSSQPRSGEVTLARPTAPSRPHNRRIPHRSRQHSDRRATPSSSSSPLPSQAHGQAMVGQPTQGTLQSAQKPPSSGLPGRGVYVPSAADPQDESLQLGQSPVVPEHSDTTTVPDFRLSPALPASGGRAVRQTPPPYQPAPPYHRPSDHVDEPADSSAGLSRCRDDGEEVSSSSFSQPDSTAVQYSQWGDSGDGLHDPSEGQRERLSSVTSDGEKRSERLSSVTSDGLHYPGERRSERLSSVMSDGEKWSERLSSVTSGGLHYYPGEKRSERLSSVTSDVPYYPGEKRSERLSSVTSDSPQFGENRQPSGGTSLTDVRQSASAGHLYTTGSRQGVREGTYPSQSNDAEGSVRTRCGGWSGAQNDGRVPGEDPPVSSSPYNAKASGGVLCPPHAAQVLDRGPCPQYPSHTPGRDSSPQYPFRTPGRDSSPQYPSQTPGRDSSPQYPSHTPGRDSSSQYPSHTPGTDPSPQYLAQNPSSGPSLQYPAYTPDRDLSLQDPIHTPGGDSRPQSPADTPCRDPRSQYPAHTPGRDSIPRYPPHSLGGGSRSRHNDYSFHSSGSGTPAPCTDHCGDTSAPPPVPPSTSDAGSRHFTHPAFPSSPPYTSTPVRPRSTSRDLGFKGQLWNLVSQTPLDSCASSSSPKPHPSSSPKSFDSSSTRSCRSSSAQGFEVEPGMCERTFGAYPNPYGEPLEVGDPLINRYEDVALFKSLQDPSQVSSSTDSGYGHGQPIYGVVRDYRARRSGSPPSSLPSHRDTPVRKTSSSQGTASRETTPQGTLSKETPPSWDNTSDCQQGFSQAHFSAQECRNVFRTVLHKDPGLGFSIAGGRGARDLDPFRPGDHGIFVTKVQPESPAASVIQPGDKLLQVNQVDFLNIDHTTAVNVLKMSSTVHLLLERVHRINLV